MLRRGPDLNPDLNIHARSKALSYSKEAKLSRGFYGAAGVDICSRLKFLGKSEL